MTPAEFRALDERAIVRAISPEEVLGFRARLATLREQRDAGDRLAAMILDEYGLAVWCGERPDRALKSAEMEVRRAWKGVEQ